MRFRLLCLHLVLVLFVSRSPFPRFLNFLPPTPTPRSIPPLANTLTRTDTDPSDINRYTLTPAQMLENEYPLPSYLASSLGLPASASSSVRGMGEGEGEGWVETPEPEPELGTGPGDKDEEGEGEDEEEEGGVEKEEKEEEGDKKPVPVPVYAIDCEMVSSPLRVKARMWTWVKTY